MGNEKDVNGVKPFHKYYEPSETEIQKAKELYCAERMIPLEEAGNDMDDIFYWTIKNLREGLI